MKQRILSAALALCLFFSYRTVALAWEGGLSPQEDILTEESTSELSTRDSTIPTPTEVYEAMIALKDQEGYQEGTAWTNDTPYPDAAGAGYQWKGGTLGGGNIVAVGCVAFAFTLSDAAFDSLPARIYGAGAFAFEDIKVGDILQVNGDSHTVIVLSVSDAGVIVAEGNYNSSVHWGRAIPKDEVMSTASHYITRYPEGYVPPDDPTANEIVDNGSLDGGLVWKLTRAGTLTISGSGVMPDFGSAGEQPWNAYSSRIRKVVIEDGVTSIGSCAFWNCEIFSAEISSSVAAIGNSAFRGASLLSVTIPSGVKTIGDSAFRECPSLISVTISEGVETIGQNAFRSCASLDSITLPASIGEVGDAAFFQCQAMKSATFTAGSKQVKLGDNLFTQCYELASVTLPQSIDCIGAGMFQNCLMLTGIEIPQGAESIGGSAFASCSRLTAIVIPDSVTSIGIAAFGNCSVTDIYFTGTEAQWNSINKIGDTASEVSKATIHYEYQPGSTTPPEQTPSPEPTTPPEQTPSPEPTTPPEQTPSPEPTTPPEQTPSPEPATPPGQTPAPGAGVPFIDGGSGQEGWETIREQAANASEGEIRVNMNGAHVVPGGVIESVKGQDVTVSFDMGNGIVWSVNGRNVTADHAGDVDLSVQVGISAIPQELVNNVAGNRQATQLGLAHNGDFGYSAVLRINVGAANAGCYANLYHYNESAGRLEYVMADRIDGNGIAELTFTHASDYVIVIEGDDGEEDSGETPSESDGGSAFDGSGSQGAEVRSPKTGEGFGDDGLSNEGSGTSILWLLLTGAVGMAAAFKRRPQ